MAKYKLLNEETHSIVYTNRENRKNQLLNKGFNICEKTTSKKTKERKNGRRKEDRD